jgi:hypothetical protein
MQGIPHRGRFEHAALIFELGARAKLLEELAQGGLLFQAEESFGMFARERYVITGPRHLNTQLLSKLMVGSRGEGEASPRPQGWKL